MAESTDRATDSRSAELFVVASVLLSTTLFNPLVGLGAIVGTVTLGLVARRYGRTLRARRRRVVIDLVTRPTPPAIDVGSTPEIDGHVGDELFERAVHGDVIADSQLRILSRLCPHEARLRRQVRQLDDAVRTTAVG